MLRTRASPPPAFSLPSIGDHSAPPARANTIGTSCGRPLAAMAASVSAVDSLEPAVIATVAMNPTVGIPTRVLVLGMLGEDASLRMD